MRTRARRITFLIFSLLFFVTAIAPRLSPVQAEEQWTREGLEDLIKRILGDLHEPGDPNERLEGPFWEWVMNWLKDLVVDLGNKTKVSMDAIRKDVAEIINGYDGLKETDKVTMSTNEKEQTVSMHYHRKLPGYMADELGLSRNWEVFELRILNVPRDIIRWIAKHLHRLQFIHPVFAAEPR